MENRIIFSAGTTPACDYAARMLRSLGLRIVDTPSEAVTHVLLDVPVRQMCPLEDFHPDVTLCGGRLDAPGHRVVDFLKDEEYLCRNAYITAECALDVAMPCLNRTFRRLPVLILGWGRIGKCLSQLLRDLGADVTVAVRNPSQRAILRALGYDSELISELEDMLPRFRLIYNTVPHPVLSREALALCREDCVKIELASSDGMEGEDIIIARGLPGIHMSESSGELIARTYLRLC